MLPQWARPFKLPQPLRYDLAQRFPAWTCRQLRPIWAPYERKFPDGFTAEDHARLHEYIAEFERANNLRPTIAKGKK